MRTSNRKTLTLFAAFLALVGAAVLLERPWVKERDLLPRVQLQEGLAPEKVTRLEIKGQGVDTVLDKVHDTWTVTMGGKAFPADPEAIKRALKNLEVLNRGIVVARDKARHKEFLLDDGTGLRVAIFYGSLRQMEFILGKQGLDVFSGYARLAGKDEVLMVPGYLIPTYQRELKGWRDLRIMNLDPATAVAVEITRGADTLVLRKNEKNGWVPDSPAGIADPRAVDAFIAVLEALKGIDAVDLPPADTGLDKPALTVTVISKNGERRGFVVGNEVAESHNRYARALSGGTILLLGPTAYEALAAELIRN